MNSTIQSSCDTFFYDIEEHVHNCADKLYLPSEQNSRFWSYLARGQFKNISVLCEIRKTNNYYHCICIIILISSHNTHNIANAFQKVKYFGIIDPLEHIGNSYKTVIF